MIFKRKASLLPRILTDNLHVKLLTVNWNINDCLNQKELTVHVIRISKYSSFLRVFVFLHDLCHCYADSKQIFPSFNT